MFVLSRHHTEHSREQVHSQSGWADIDDDADSYARNLLRFKETNLKLLLDNIRNE